MACFKDQPTTEYHSLSVDKTGLEFKTKSRIRKKIPTIKIFGGYLETAISAQPRLSAIQGS